MATTGMQLEKSRQAVAIVQVPAGVDALWTRARVLWASMSRAQRGWGIVAVGLLAMLLGGLLWYGLRTDWRTLYAGMDPDDARQTGSTLTQARIPYDVAANGTAIRVPAPMLDKARLATATRGVRSGRLGFELFDKPNWVGSEFDENVNFQRALEGELERTVGTLTDVESARVHLVLEHNSLFRDQDRPAKASVVLKLRHGALADGEADAIRNLVASSVDGLVQNRVTLVDAAGHLPLGPKTPETLKLSAEQALEEKIVTTLEPVTGPGNVRAAVTLEYDPESSDMTEETYNPDKTAALTMQRTEQTSGPLSIPAGIPGTASNAPNTQALPVYPSMKSQPTASKSESGTYAISKVVHHLTRGPDSVRRMTAAIVVNDRLVSTSNKGEPTQWRSRSADELRTLNALAQAAVGFNPARGDVLTVQDLAFDQNRPTPPASLSSRALETAESAPQLMKYSALLLGLFFVIIFGVRPALSRANGLPGKTMKKAGTSSSSERLPAEDTSQLPSPKPTESDPNRQHSLEILEQVSDHLKRDPTQSSRLLQSWIHSDS